MSLTKNIRTKHVVVQVNMTGGSAYAVVLDGYNGNFGKYQIDITAEQVRTAG